MTVAGEERIIAMVAAIDKRTLTDCEEAWEHVRPLGFAVVPYFLAAYPTFKHSAGRVTLVYHATRYARIGDAAFRLGLAALSDRAKIVRYRACGLLAYSLRSEGIPALATMRNDVDDLVRRSSFAAIRAISSGNHHLFFDDQNSGRVEWSVNPGDGEDSWWLAKRLMLTSRTPPGTIRFD